MSTCSDCGGLGIVKVLLLIDNCEDCEGSGIKCEDCEYCSSCQGLGKVFFTRSYMCTKCDGKGHN